jgi:transposase
MRMDAGYTDAELFATSQLDYGIDIVGPIRSNGSWQAKAEQGFDLSSFHIDWETKTVTCPQGRNSKHWTPERTAWNQEVIEVSFAKKDCLACPQRAFCTKAKTDPRTLTLRPQRQYEALQAARKRQETSEFRQLYAKRAGVEGTLSQGIRGFGLRHCRYIGLSKTHLQHIFTAMAMNSVRSVAWIHEVPHAKTRTSRFAALRVSTGGSRPGKTAQHLVYCF